MVLATMGNLVTTKRIKVIMVRKLYLNKTPEYLFICMKFIIVVLRNKETKSSLCMQAKS